MKEKIKAELEYFSLKYETRDYFLKLSASLANLYINFFELYNKDFTYNNSTLKETKLDLSQFIINEKDLRYLDYANNDIMLYLDASSYLIADLKGNVTKLVINGKEKTLITKINYQDLLNNLAQKYGLSVPSRALNAINERLYLTSLIYHYAFYLISENKRTKQGYKAGMFKNAYHDIIAISETKLQNLTDSEKNKLSR